MFTVKMNALTLPSVKIVLKSNIFCSFVAGEKIFHFLCYLLSFMSLIPQKAHALENEQLVSLQGRADGSGSEMGDGGTVLTVSCGKTRQFGRFSPYTSNFF